MRRPDRATRVGPASGLTAGRTLAIVAVVCAMLGAALTASAPPAGLQAAAAKAPQTIVLSTGEFHGYAATADYLKKVAAANPAITELVEIGRSAGNRPIFVLVVSNMKKGVVLDALVPLQNTRKPAVNNVTPMKLYQGKPALWIDGGAHGAVLAGTEICLYVIDKLVSGYGADADVTRLIDDNAFYVCPMVFADGGIEAGKPAPRAETPTSANGNYPEGWWKDDDTAGRDRGVSVLVARGPRGARVLHEPHEHPLRPVVPRGRRADGPPVCAVAREPGRSARRGGVRPGAGEEVPRAGRRVGACGVERAAGGRTRRTGGCGSCRAGRASRRRGRRARSGGGRGASGAAGVGPGRGRVADGLQPGPAGARRLRRVLRLGLRPVRRLCR